MGVSLNALPFTFINVGERYIASGLTAILIATTPINTALLAHFMLDTEKLTRSKISGIILAFIGVLIVYLPNLHMQEEGSQYGILLMLLAAVSYAFANYSRETTLARFACLGRPYHATLYGERNFSAYCCAL